MKHFLFFKYIVVVFVERRPYLF